MYYRNKDGTKHERKGIWIDNDLRGEVIHTFPERGVKSPMERTCLYFDFKVFIKQISSKYSI